LARKISPPSSPDENKLLRLPVVLTSPVISPEIVGEERVLLVSVSAPAKVAMSASVTAVLN